jgi:hypothetical protein
MADTVDTNALPGAVLEETFWPDQIVVIPNDDGSVHMLMYVGESGVDGGFFSLKHAIISPEHSAGLFRQPESPPAPLQEEVRAGENELEQVRQWRRPERHTLPVPEPEEIQRAPLLDPDLLV